MDKKSLDIIVEEFFDTGRLVLNEWSDKFWKNSDYPNGKLVGHLIELYEEGNGAYKKDDKKTAIQKYQELLKLWDDVDIMDDSDRHNLTIKKGIHIGEVRTRLGILLTTPEEEERSTEITNIINNNTPLLEIFFRSFSETSKLYERWIWDVKCDISYNDNGSIKSNNGTQEECFNKLKAYIRIVNIWYEKLIPLLGEMNEAELKSLSRGGDNEFRFFKNKRWSNYEKIDVLLEEMGKMYIGELQQTYKAAINKIHELTKQKGGEHTKLSDIDLSIDYYRELKNIISKMSWKLPYPGEKVFWERRIESNIFNNIRSKLILKKAEKKDFQGLIDLSDELRKIIGNADDKLIEMIINLMKNTSYVQKMVDEYNLSFENREDLINWISKFRKNQYFKQFEEVVRDIEPEEIEDSIWKENLVPLLNDFSVDNEEVNELIELIKEKEKKLTELIDIRNNSNDINHGKVQIPKLQLEIPQLKEQLKLIDPIKEFFDSNPKWRRFLTYWKYCPEAQEEYEEIEKFLKKSYGNKNYEEVLLSQSQIKERKKLYDESLELPNLDCDITFSGLTKSLELKNKRETLHNELISNFEENDELVLKCIRLVDQIFMSIIENGVYEQNQQQNLLKKYKSYINMIKIYSEGENQKEKLSQLIYDLNQLKGVVDSYDSLRNEAIPVDAEGDENDGRSKKLLTKTTLRTLLKNISFNSWDANEIKEYFVAVREHKNVAYEKSFEKECENQQYFERVDGGNNPAIVLGNNNITLVEELLKKDDNENLLPVSAVTETIFEKVRDLLNDEDLVNRKLKKYDIKTTQNVTLTPYNREGENITIVADTFIEVKDARPGDYHFSEFFGVYKNKKETDTAYNTITTSGDPEQNLARYEQFVEELVYRFNGNEGETILNTIKNRIGGIFFENYLFAHIDDITFSWSPTGQGTSRENRVSIRVIPDMNRLYYWKEGNSNCGNQFKYPNCETDSGCVPDNLEESITNFFDTGNFEF